MQLTKGAIGNLINRYKAVLKKCHLMNTFGSLAVAGMLVMGGAGMATAADDMALGGGSREWSGDADHLMGGNLYKGNVTFPEVTTPGDISLSIKGGTIEEIIGGSYVSGNNDQVGNVTLGNISTTIQDGSSTEFVVGGSKISNDVDATLATGKTSLTINGGTFGKEGENGGYELVMGGNYVKTGTDTKNTASAEGSRVTVNGGIFHASVVGGSVAHRYNGNNSIMVEDNGSTSVVINGGTFSPSQSNLADSKGGINLSAAVIGGGLAYGANTNSVLGSKEAPVTSSVSISGDKTAINGKVVAGSVVANNGGTAANNGGTAIVHGNTTLAMAGGTAHDDLIGGGMVEVENAAKLPEDGTSEYHLNITGDSSVTVTGDGKALGEVIGGNYVKTSTAGLENSAKVANSSVTITGGKFANVDDSTNKAQYIIGGSKTNASKGGNATTLVEGNSSVLIDGNVDIKDGALIGGSQAKAGNGETPKATAIVKGNSSVTVNNGNLAGVVGGGIAETYYSTTATAESTVDGTSFVAINGGTIEGIAYGAVAAGKSSAAVVGGGLANDAGSKATVGNTSVTIADGTINGKVVAGGAAANGGNSGVEGDTSLTMTDGKVDGDLIGGGFVDSSVDSSAGTANNKANVGGSTHITVSGGSLVDAEIIGGGSVRNATGEANVTGDTHVTVTKYANELNDQQWVQYVLGGGKAMTNGTQTATANVAGSTNVTIGEQGATGKALDIQFGTVAGGGLARAQKGGDEATANVTNANVTVHSGILSGVAGGGIAESYNNGTAKATVTGAANLTINGGTINGVKYKGVDTNKVKVAVLGGGIAKGTGATADATTTTNTVINGGKINGHVVAGGLADGGTANVTNANLTINGGEINGSVYAGGAALNSGTATVENFDVRITGGTITKDVVAGNYTGDTGASTFTLLGASPYSGGSSKGSITIGGDATIGGKVDASAEGVATNVIIDGADAEVTGGYEGNKDSTLTFNNYDAKFDKTATGFGTLSVAEGSNVQMENLSTGAKGDQDDKGFFGGAGGNDVKVNGKGTVKATNVTATDGKTITVADGGTLDAGKLTTTVEGGSAGTVKTEGLGSTLVIGNTDLDTIANDSLSSTAGSEIRFDNLDDDIALATIQGTLATDNKGIVNVGDTKVTGLSDLVVDGKVSYKGWKDGAASGFTTDAMKQATLTEIDSAFTDTGSFGSAELSKNTQLNVGIGGSSGSTPGNLTLTGLDGNAFFAMKANGEVADASVAKDSSLTLGDNAYAASKSIGKVTLGKAATLGVLGAGWDVATVNSGAISATGVRTTVNATNVTLNVAGNIGADTQAIGTITADAANINATGGDITANTVTLKNNGLLQAVATTGDTPAGGDITIDGNLSGQGMVDAGQTLTLKSAYNGLEDDDLLLTGKKLDAKAAINSTKGTLAIVTDELITGGDTTLVDDTLVADNVDLGGALNASGESLVVVQNFGSFAPDGGFTPGALDNAVSVTGQSLMVYGAGAEQAQQAVAETGHTGAAYYAGKELKLVDGGGLTVGDTADGADAVAFGSGSLLVVDGTAMNGKTVFTGEEASPNLTASVNDSSKLHVDNAIAGNFTVFDSDFDTTSVNGWADENVTTDSAMLDASYDPTNSNVTVKTNNAHTVFPNLSDGMADAVNDLYNGKLNNVDSTDMGVRFLSRATNDHFLGADKDAAAATIESAARIAFAGAVPQMTKMASDAGTNAVVNRLGFANPADGAQAMDAEGKIVDRNTTGFALWIAPLWQSQHGWGMEADNLDYGFNGNLGGVSLGADYTFENAIRAGITFNIGGGYAESSGGDLNSTENRMSFWGLGAYAGWNYENFGLMADVSYTSTWNDLKQDMDSRMGMGDLEADVQASAISAGLRAEYKLETSVLDVIPHIGVRYMSLNTWGFDAESNGGTVLEGDGFHQDIWTFPVGVTFTKDFTLDSGWSFKPSIDFSVIPAAGDIKAKQDVAFTGLPGTYEVETQMMDYLTWQGGVGLELGNDTMSFGVNYTLQAGQHTTGHGVFGSFRYEF